MNKLNLPPFYVGQKVVAIKSHSQGIFKKGDVFKVKALMKPCCYWVCDIGIENISDIMECNCGNEYKSSVWAIACHVLAPIQEAKPPLMTFTQIKETEKEEILILN